MCRDRRRFLVALLAATLLVLGLSSAWADPPTSSGARSGSVGSIRRHGDQIFPEPYNLLTTNITLGGHASCGSFYNAAGNITITLPLAMLADKDCYYEIRSGGTVTVVTQGTDLVNDVTSISLPIGTWARFRTNNITAWTLLQSIGTTLSATPPITYTPGGAVGLAADANFAVVANSLALAPIANGSVLGNAAGGSAEPTGTTLTALIDQALGSTRGSILERGVSGWQILAPGTATFPLTSNGAGADPSYQAFAPSVFGSQTAKTVLAAPSGGSGTPTFRVFPCGDLSNSGTACQANTGTSGANVPLLNGANTWSANQSLSSVTLVTQLAVAYGGTNCAAASITCINNISGGSLAGAVVGTSDAQTLTTKTIDFASNTGSGVGSISGTLVNTQFGSGTAYSNIQSIGASVDFGSNAGLDASSAGFMAVKSANFAAYQNWLANSYSAILVSTGGSSTLCGAPNVYVNSTTGITFCSSDARLKHDIRAMSPLRAVWQTLRFAPSFFKLNSDQKAGEDGPDHGGFIAQQVRRVIPEAVKENPDGYLSIEPLALVAVLAGALKLVIGWCGLLTLVIGVLIWRLRRMNRRLAALEARFA